jgi:hypothetical protein
MMEKVFDLACQSAPAVVRYLLSSNFFLHSSLIFQGLALFQTKQAAEYTCSKKKQIYSKVQGGVVRKWHPLVSYEKRSF